MRMGLPFSRTFRVPTIGDTNMDDEKTCEVESTLTPFTIRPHGDLWLWILGRYKNKQNNSLHILK